MRERILDAALTVLQQEGPEGMSIRKIAERVNVSHMSLYSYFDNQAAIIKALRERGFEQMQALCDASLRRAQSGDALTQVRESLNQFIELSHTHPRLYQLAWRRWADDSSFRVNSQNLAKVLKHFSELIQLCVERGQCIEREPTLAAVMAFSIVNGTLILYHNVAPISQTDRAQLETETIEAAITYLTRSEQDGGD